MRTRDRQPAVAGTFYTNQPQLLRDQVRSFLDNCLIELDGTRHFVNPIFAASLILA